MRILNRYIRNAVISSSLLVVLVLLGIESFMEFINQLPDIGIAHYNLLSASLYVVAQLPSDLYQLFPMAGFLGCLVGLGRLASSSQLIVMRTAGMSIAQITMSVIKAAILMIVIVTFIGEFVAPKLELKAATMKSLALSHEIGFKSLGGIWLRNSNSFVHIGRVDSNHTVSDVSRFVVNSQHRLITAAYAKKAVFRDGHWHMMDALQSRFSFARITKHRIHDFPLKVIFNPISLEEGEKSVDQQSIVGLDRSIDYREQARLETSQYKFAFWQRIFQPLITIIMICLGVPFLFGLLRSSTMGSRVLVGVIVGFAFYMLNQFFGPFTMVYQLPPLLAAIMPTVLFALACVILLRRSRE